MADKTFYFGQNARRMSGPREVDLDVDPPPDLAIEVEVSHPPTEALAVYERLGVPEVWHLKVGDALAFRILARQPDGHYAEVDRSAFLPLAVEDVLERMRMAGQVGAGPWHLQLAAWVRDVPLARNP